MEELSNTAISNVLGQSPLHLDGEDSVERVDIEAAVKDGSLSVEQGLGQMQRQLERQFADLERRLSANGSCDTTSLISRMLARHTEAPSNQHQVAAFCMASSDPALARQARRLLVWSYAIVLLQTVATIGVFAGVFQPACQTSDQCNPGSFCRADAGRCEYCGEADMLEMETEGTCTLSGATRSSIELTVEDDGCDTYNDPHDPNFVDWNRTAVDILCNDPTSSLINRAPELFTPAVTRSWCDAW